MARELYQLSAQEFERELLASAQLDTAAPDVQAAWNRFALLAGGVALSAESLSGVHRLQSQDAASSNTVLSGAVSPAAAPDALPTVATSATALTSTALTSTALPTAVFATPGLAAKWLVSGALMGALVTSGLFLLLGSEPLSGSRATPREPGAAIAVAIAAERQTSESNVVALPSAGEQTLSIASAAPDEVSGVQGNVLPQSQTGQRLQRASRVAREAAAREPLLLAAEVRLVDGARRAVRDGSPALAFHWIERYRGEFPSGALRADIAYLEIKALAALGRNSEVRRSAERFLAAYPRDPHLSQVKRIHAACVNPQ